MKKLFIIQLILLFVVSNVNAQVNVKARSGYGFGTRCTFHVEDVEPNGLQLTMTLIDNLISLPEKPTMLIKLMDDTTLELKGNRTYGKVEKWMGTDYHKDAATFDLTQEQFKKMAEGIKKLRINTQPKPFEKEWKNGKFGKELYKDYQKSEF